MSTTMAAFKAALYQAVRSRGAGPGISITYGAKADRSKASFVIGGAKTATDEPIVPAGFRGGKPPRLDEQYTVEVLVEYIGGTDPQVAETRVVEMAQAVEDAVYDDAVRSVPGVVWALVTGRELDAGITPDGGPAADYTLTITVKARTP